MPEENKTISEQPKGKLGTLGFFLSKIRGIRQEKWGDKSGYLFIFPLVVLWLVFGAFPYIRGIIIPFQDYRWLNSESWSPLNSFNGVANFIEMFQDPRVWTGIKAAFFLYLSWFPITFALSLITAIILSKIRAKKISAVYRVIITLPWVIPLAASMPMWANIYEPNFGYLNHFLSDILKIWKNPPAWGSDTFWYWPAVGIACCWKGFGYYMLLFLIGFYNIPEEQYEAARLDGANAWQEFWHISLPGIRNIMFLFLVTNVSFLGAGVVEMMTFGSGPMDIGQTLNLYGWKQAFEGNMRMGYAASMWFFSGVVSLISVSLIFKFFKTEKA